MSMGNVAEGDVFELMKVHFAWQACDVGVFECGV